MPSKSNRLTQGTFSFLPELTDAQIAAQVQYCLDRGWAVSIEHTDEAHPRNTYWEMWKPPMFDLASVGPFMEELAACRDEMKDHYIRIAAFDSTKGWESLRASFIVQRPAIELGFRLDRLAGPGRSQSYSTNPYAAQRPTGQRSR